MATIKPVKEPDPANKQDRIEGRRYSTRFTTLRDLLMMAYRLDERQISGGPAWIATDEFDIDAAASGEIHTSDEVWTMLQRLLTDRFQITFHREQREMPVYVLAMGRNGPRLKAAESNGQHSSGCQGLGVCNFRNESLPEFARWMQFFVVDRPVLDKTGMAGTFDFALKWTPDQSSPGESANAPPGLFTSIQEQLGLKLEPTKGPVEVLVIDHVERPSEN